MKISLAIFPFWEQLIALLLSLAALAMVVIRVVAWFRKRRDARLAVIKARELVVDQKFLDLCKGQSEIFDKLEDMDRLRTEASKENDLIHRTILASVESSEKTTLAYRAKLEEKLDVIVSDVNLCVISTGTSLDGILQLAESSGNKVNGNVLRLHSKLKNRIEDGVNSAAST